MPASQRKRVNWLWKTVAFLVQKMKNPTFLSLPSSLDDQKAPDMYRENSSKFSKSEIPDECESLVTFATCSQHTLSPWVKV
ncbi:hypothetical protein GW7_10392 [Heterocephalus glaber]|uniref:Uncharacterized protein n=1 Tax=Heterocephalus glaber TaxID=10181 RepID=G5BLR7_HETGA|nr:hypothetical protein GW7_10392 [Heterocephalus glaber]